MALQPIFGEHTVNQFSLMLRDRQINLNPGFQRKSVWTANDRRRLIQSIVSGYPLPSVFLYKRIQDGRVIYDVIDGKQRLESIFMFTRLGRFKRDKFDVKLDIGDGLQWYDWLTICRHHKNLRAEFQSYKVQIVEVTGDLADIIDVFVRINSTGKRLTSGEKRHARFYNSRFLKEARHLVGRYQGYLRKHRILTPAQLDRMKGTELFSELLMSLHNGGPINKKTALDRSIGNESINAHTLSKLSKEFSRTLRLMKRMFPDISQTRFRNTTEFYSLFLLVWEMDKDKFALSDKRRNRIAFELLRRLSTGVDELREQLRKAKPAKSAQRLYADYLLTVQGDTDSSANRERRRELLRGLLFSIYDRKDDKRTFSQEQRRILWNNDERRVCPRCGDLVRWKDFTVDHIRAYAKGGKTWIRNAQIMHRACNASKGAR
jgi:Protein of unknown function DUF262/HNH endonuclease